MDCPFDLQFMEKHVMHLLYLEACYSFMENAGLALLELRARITSDPYFGLANWNPNDCEPCKWSGVHCVDGKVQIL